jgi:hypothetical protein
MFELQSVEPKLVVTLQNHLPEDRFEVTVYAAMEEENVW